MSQKLKGVEKQPIAAIKWVPREELRANSYNPNRVFPPELKLLRISILTDGWTQPIVARKDNEIVDGFHRWMAADDKEVLAMTDGKVPVVYLDSDLTYDRQVMSTIRHNRARGSHAVLKMADIIRSLIDDHGFTVEQVMQQLQMEDEEVDRLYDASGMPVRGGSEEFGKGWRPTKDETEA